MRNINQDKKLVAFSGPMARRNSVDARASPIDSNSRKNFDMISEGRSIYKLDLNFTDA